MRPIGPPPAPVDLSDRPIGPSLLADRPIGPSGIAAIAR